MSSTTCSWRHKCLFDAAGSESWRGFWMKCSLCGWASVWTGMVKCERDTCREGYAHKRCVQGALKSDFQDSIQRTRSDQVLGGWVADDRHDHAADTTAADSSTQTDVPAAEEVACADGWAQTDDTPAAEEVAYADGWVQTEDTPAAEEVVACAEGWTQTSVAICSDVACGDEVTYVDGTSQTTAIATSEDTCGDDVTFASAVDTVFADDPLPTSEEVAVKDTELEDDQESTLSQTDKYWKLRFDLFSKFDSGIMLDEISMRHACPEVLSRHLANRCWYRTVLDPFCGAGGNAIQLTFTCQRVIAMDVDAKNIALAKRNAELYGVAHRIKFMVGDFFLLAGGDLRADAVVTSPPWGELGNSRHVDFDVGDTLNHESRGLATVIRMASAVAPKVVLHLPKNFDRTQQCLQMAISERFSHVKFESVTIDGEPKRHNIYLTRNDTSAKGPPIKFSGAVHLRTPSLFKKQILERSRTDNIVARESYFKSVHRFLDA